MHTTVMVGRRCYRQGRGHRGGSGRRRYRKGHGSKMQKFKGFLRKSAEFGKRHILPHLKEIGMNTLLDIMEGKNAKQALRSNFGTARNNFVRQQRRRHPR